MQAAFEQNPHDSAQPVGVDKSAVLANILRGCEDFTLDLSGRIISSNLEAINITGYEEWEVIGRHFSIFYTEQDRTAGVPEQDLKKINLHSKITFSAWRLKKRSASFWAQITMSSLKDDRGIVGYKMIMKDQTHRLISNQRIRKFRNEYLNLFNNPFIGIVKFRMSDLRIMLINSNAAKIIDSKELSRLSEIFAKNEDFELFFSKLREDGQVMNFEFRVNRKSEKETWARVDCRVFESEGFAEGIITDVTKSKNQLLELKKLNEELDNFIYHASHDLRSPLTTLLGLINLAEVDSQIDLEDYCNMMRDRVVYLDELLRDLASITYNNRSDLAIEPIDFKDLVLKQISELQPASRNADISFECDCRSEIFSDKYRLRTVIKNLISNALRHTSPAQVPSFIKISVVTSEGKALIKVRDNGRGIRDEQILHVFGMFYKASNEIKETGLSLYIVKLMVDKLGGKIKVQSKIGSGTEFEIELPSLHNPEFTTLKTSRADSKALQIEKPAGSQKEVV
ncbi:histidine kinase [Cytophagales bacterium WSM2-2]|nr:histidine kinase [Cytophagales bacterium WSM2-2]